MNNKIEEVKYHYLIMTQKEFLESEALEESLRERANYFQIRKRYRDFWVLNSPLLVYLPNIYEKIKLSNFYTQKKSQISAINFNKDNADYFTVLISLDQDFMNWIQLRLGEFENIEKINTSKDEQLKKFKSNGIYGSFILNENSKIKSPLISYSNYIHPEILLEKNKKFLEVYSKLIQNDISKKIN